MAHFLELDFPIQSGEEFGAMWAALGLFLIGSARLPMAWTLAGPQELPCQALA
jgi:hypothetical protein